MEPTAPNNKIKILKKNQIIDEKKEQEIAKETPNMFKDETYNTTIAPAKELSTNKQFTSSLGSLSNTQKEYQKVIRELEKRKIFTILQPYLLLLLLLLAQNANQQAWVSNMFGKL
ncbi:MAG: hypothetical protein RCG15_04510 [Candidatus Rickettsia vulgarisii]